MPISSEDKVIGIAISNPKFRKQLLDPKVDNAALFKDYGIKPTPSTLAMDKNKLQAIIGKKLITSAWCIGNACGLGT